jgi:hypothetical protein
MCFGKTPRSAKTSGKRALFAAATFGAYRKSETTRGMRRFDPQARDATRMSRSHDVAKKMKRAEENSSARRLSSIRFAVRYGMP